jgi:hypothetical protein
MRRVATSPQAFGPTSAAPCSAFVILLVGAYARGEFFYLAAYFFPAFGVAASCEEISELVVSAVLAETLKKIAAIEPAKNFIVGS